MDDQRRILPKDLIRILLIPPQHGRSQDRQCTHDHLPKSGRSTTIDISLASVRERVIKLTPCKSPWIIPFICRYSEANYSNP